MLEEPLGVVGAPRTGWPGRAVVTNTGVTMKLVLQVTSLKNEGPYVIEWLAFHKSVGFDHVVIFENDSDDFTDLILKRLDAMGRDQFREELRVRRQPAVAFLQDLPRHGGLQDRRLGLLHRRGRVLRPQAA